jgi:hypothetical protein
LSAQSHVSCSTSACSSLCTHATLTQCVCVGTAASNVLTTDTSIAHVLPPSAVVRLQAVAEQTEWPEAAQRAQRLLDGVDGGCDPQHTEEDIEMQAE